MSLPRDSIGKIVHEKGIRLLSVEYVDFGGISRTKARTAGELDDFLENGVGFAKGNFGIAAFDTIASDPSTNQIERLDSWVRSPNAASIRGLTGVTKDSRIS